MIRKYLTRTALVAAAAFAAAFIGVSFLDRLIGDPS